MKHIIISSLFALISFTTNAQIKGQTSVKAELGFSNNIYNIIDPGKSLKVEHRGTKYIGLNIQHDIANNAFIQLGVGRKNYDLQWGFKREDGFSEDILMNTWLLQIGVGTRLNISKEKIHLVPSIGYTHAINRIYDWGTSKGTGYSYGSADTMRYTATLERHQKSYSLMQTSLAIEFALNKRSFFSISGNYFRGLKVVASNKVVYSHNSSPSNTGTINSKGDFYSVNLGFRYQLGRIFRK